MNFAAELAAKVMAGEKTVTRRMPSENPRSPWWRERCGFEVGRDYAVCPGRGKHAIGRIEIVATRLSQLEHALLSFEAEAEGFSSGSAFLAAWRRMDGSWDPDLKVWRVEFKLVEADRG